MTYEELSSWNIPLKAVPLRLPVSYATVLRWRKAGVLACRRIGGRLYTSEDALAAACPVEGGGPVVSELRRRHEKERAIRRVHAQLLRTGTDGDTKR